MNPRVRPAQQADIGELAQTMAQAFNDDPIMAWILPDPKARPAKLNRLFATMTRHHHLAGGGVQVATDGEVIGAAALWDPPHRWRESRWTLLAQVPAFLRVFGFRSGRGRALQEAMHRVHPDEPHWYLSAIGSDPALRGRGFGQALMRSSLARCDGEYCPAYLESTKAENLPYYRRFGFAVTGEIVLPDGGPTLWPMWRDPR